MTIANAMAGATYADDPSGSAIGVSPVPGRKGAALRPTCTRPVAGPWLASNSDVNSALCDKATLTGHNASQPISIRRASRPNDSRRTPANGSRQHAGRRPMANTRYSSGCLSADRQMPRLLPPLLMVAGLMGWVAGCAPVLVAPPQLVAVWPAPGARLPVSQTSFELTFNRALHPERTWATVSRDEDGSPISVDSTVQPSNPRRLSVFLKEPARGQYRLHWHAVAVRTAAAVDGEQTFSLQDESVAPPRIEVSPLAAETGEKLQVTGKGFDKHCAVRLTIGDDEQALSTVETDASGSFEVEARVPQTVPFGQQPISATDGCGAATTAAV